ncbi:hypothetical protein EUZ85_20175 [Hahella sp. KA22]|uniref:hypothetical protein n=1 Tax=Hahella sp. KA22 TaxID=1628392 RepID=UPI000FDEA9DE|nr:hypothetical protein [Hahella sp. KA22]AZZ92918.1 hypothetical protein ENC22_17595 [Hahella sp. KA22]QAY56292.1 hypothetical protein EUZ85_20175 [Hahella sp. KA22]
MDLIFEPFVGLGPLKFGMSKSEVESLQAEVCGIGDCDYQDGKLSAFSIYPADAEHLIIIGEDVQKMDKFSAALHLANLSADYGQAQGGSLYFMDLGCAILQFESPSREFLFFAREYDTGEPLREMALSSIKSYYEDNAWDA